MILWIYKSSIDFSVCDEVMIHTVIKLNSRRDSKRKSASSRSADILDLLNDDLRLGGIRHMLVWDGESFSLLGGLRRLSG